MYTENKRKESLSLEDSNTNVNPNSYLSTINARKNPDVLAPGGLFIKGNKYFSKKISSENKQNEDENKEDDS